MTSQAIPASTTAPPTRKGPGIGKDGCCQFKVMKRHQTDLPENETDVPPPPKS